MLLLPAVQSHIRFIRPQNPMNNSNALSSLPKSFPIPIEGRDDFFSVDPRSLSIEQLNKYKTEIDQLINVEKNNFEKIQNNSSARIDTYKHGMLLAQETIQINSIHSQTTPRTTNFNSIDNGSFDSVDPKTLTTTQLRFYIEGIKEEITYEKKLTDEFEKELASRIQAYQSGIQCANYGEITPNHKYLNRYFLFCIFRIKHTKTKITCSID
ncbi:unnamed protein product [Rotaria magnacalcarata]|uniref:Uncharacterized protein n=3 Tax=Rotaria magnacalcarata TaxID=392030 RepID=A0A819TYA1_9BILA|nr:unnamed protein product [Rotaria magnacalcarata]